MDKRSAANQIANANVSTYDIADSIYQATVLGISGANQNEGYGFLLSAIAELWNIRGSIGNPNGRTKITGRYKGMGVTENMILDVISRYPNGLSGNTPLFDDLLEIGSGGTGKIANTTKTTNIINTSNTMQDHPDSKSTGGSFEFRDEDALELLIVVVGFCICKFVLHFGWILSIILGVILGVISERWIQKR